MKKVYLFKTKKMTDGWTLTENIKSADNIDEAIERAQEMIPAEETRFGQLVEIVICKMYQDKAIPMARVNSFEVRRYR